MYALPFDQSCPYSTLIHFVGNQSFGRHRKLGRAEVLPKGIKHMEIYERFIYIGWKWMEGAVEKMTGCSKIGQFKWGTFTPSGRKCWTLLEWWNIPLLTYRLYLHLRNPLDSLPFPIVALSFSCRLSIFCPVFISFLFLVKFSAPGVSLSILFPHFVYGFSPFFLHLSYIPLALLLLSPLSVHSSVCLRVGRDQSIYNLHLR